MAAQCFQIMPIPVGDHTFQFRVGSGRVNLRGDTLLRKLTDLPVLFVGSIPEFNRVAGIKIRFGDGIRMKEPIPRQ